MILKMTGAHPYFSETWASFLRFAQDRLHSSRSLRDSNTNKVSPVDCIGCARASRYYSCVFADNPSLSYIRSGAETPI
jgi:hypothetical protein